MIEYRLTQNLETNLRILATELEKLSLEYTEKIKTAEHPISKINDDLANEHRSGNFQGKSQAYGYAEHELSKLLDFFGVEK